MPCLTASKTPHPKEKETPCNRNLRRTAIPKMREMIRPSLPQTQTKYTKDTMEVKTQNATKKCNRKIAGKNQTLARLLEKHRYGKESTRKKRQGKSRSQHEGETIRSWEPGISRASIETDRNNIWVCVSTVCSRCAGARRRIVYVPLMAREEGVEIQSRRFGGENKVDIAEISVSNCHSSLDASILIMSCRTSCR